MNVPNDKLLHFLSGGYVFGALSLFISPHFAMIATIIVAFGKEFRDKQGFGCYEVADALATIYGGALPYVLWILKGCF